jgi:uncharacterized protein DUF6478
MRKHVRGPLVRQLDRMALRIWARRLRRADQAGPDALRKIQKRVRPLRALLDTIERTVADRLTGAHPQGDKKALPPRTNWTWRPDLRMQTQATPGKSIASDTAVSPDLRFFHDARLAELGLRQIGGVSGHQGIAADIYEFDGTYVSFAIALPTEAIAGLRLTDLFRIELEVTTERPADVNIRLNLGHGPNLERIVRRLDTARGERMVEFDISYTAFNPERSKDIWIDIIINAPRMNRIEIRDVQVLRRGRADI